MIARDDAATKIEIKSDTKSKTLTRPVTPLAPAAEAVAEAHSQRKRPESGRYLLQVDRQTKGSYQTLDAAMRAGAAIKTKHPIVQVGVYDAVECVNSPVEAAR
jgi:hypothetical protein